MNSEQKVEALAIAGHVFTSKKLKALAGRVADMEALLSELPAAEVDLAPIFERLDELAELILEVSKPKQSWTFEIIRDPVTNLITEVRAF